MRRVLDLEVYKYLTNLHFGFVEHTDVHHQYPLIYPMADNRIVHRGM